MIVVLALSALPGQVRAERGLTFEAHVDLLLCSDYASGAEVELEYSIGGSQEQLPLPVRGKQIDLEQNRGCFSFDLPSTYGTTVFNIRAYCRNSEGRSAPSNVGVVSNCNALALLDSDADGLTDNLEDTNCDNFFSPGDRSNPDSPDTDGDGVRDLVEVLAGTDPVNAGSSPRLFVASGAPFDPDGDGNANAVVWRVAQGMWYVRDFVTPGNHISFQFGLPGDVPFTYQPGGPLSDVGVVRNIQNQFYWIFHGPGFLRSTGARETVIPFGMIGDHVLIGPWDTPGISNPGVARLYQGLWSFYVYHRDGTVSQQYWGQTGDLPKVQDYDGDGVLDIAVYRLAEQTTYVIRSSDHRVLILPLGSGTADHTFRGDLDGDGVDDLTFWEPQTGMFTTMSSGEYSQFLQPRAALRMPVSELQLGLYGVHLPLSWNRQGGRALYTVVDHYTGLRYIRQDNNPDNPPLFLQWGLPGDAQG